LTPGHHQQLTSRGAKTIERRGRQVVEHSVVREGAVIITGQGKPSHPFLFSKMALTVAGIAPRPVSFVIWAGTPSCRSKNEGPRRFSGRQAPPWTGARRASPVREIHFCSPRVCRLWLCAVKRDVRQVKPIVYSRDAVPRWTMQLHSAGLITPD